MMKKTLIVIISSVILSSLAGCQKGSPADTEKPKMSLAGVWSEMEHDWVIKMADDGTISEVYRSDGLHMDLSVKGVQQEMQDENLFIQYIYGKCWWTYDQNTRILKATVTIDNFYVSAGEAELNCAIIDEFEGPVAEDGSTWKPQWTTKNILDPNAPAQVSEKIELLFTR